MVNESNLSFAGRREAGSQTIRFDIRRGRFARWLGKDQPAQEYDYIQGRLTGIAIRKQETPNGETAFMDFHFTYGDTAFDVSALASSSISAELVSKIANIQDMGATIRIDVWPKNRFTNCTVRENGQKLPFRQLPKVERRQNGFKVALDTSERDAVVMAMVDELNARFAAESGK